MKGSHQEFLRELMRNEANKLLLKRFEKRQRKTFYKIIKTRHPFLMREQKDLFAMYFSDLLLGKCDSINDFLYDKKKGYWEDKKVKSIFKVRTKDLNNRVTSNVHEKRGDRK